MIEGVDTFSFDPQEIETTRTDIFKEDHFPVFDIVVHLANRDDIEMAYHFDETMNTHVIDSINGETNWWYMAYYSGGWPETNVFRMNHFPYKDRMYIRVRPYDGQMLDRMYDVFRKKKSREKSRTMEK
ncbi:MAG: hypothetical protein ACLFV5_06535 [Anaerolineales bacterium]